MTVGWLILALLATAMLLQLLAHALPRLAAAFTRCPTCGKTSRRGTPCPWHGS